MARCELSGCALSYGIAYRELVRCFAPARRSLPSPQPQLHAGLRCCRAAARAGTTVEVEFHGQSLEDPQARSSSTTPASRPSAFKPCAQARRRLQGQVSDRPRLPARRARAPRPHRHRASATPSPSGSARSPPSTKPKRRSARTTPSTRLSPIPLNSTVEGQILPGDRHGYRHLPRATCSKGSASRSRWKRCAWAPCTHGGENDLAVRILDADGKELGRNDDSALYVQDPVLSLVAPHDRQLLRRDQAADLSTRRARRGTARTSAPSRVPRRIFPAGGQAGDHHRRAHPRRSRRASAPSRSRCRRSPATSITSGSGDSRPRPTCCASRHIPNVLMAKATAPPALRCPRRSTAFSAKPGDVHDVPLHRRRRARPGRSASTRARWARRWIPKIWIRAANVRKRHLSTPTMPSSPTSATPPPAAPGTSRISRTPSPIFKPAADGEYHPRRGRHDRRRRPRPRLSRRDRAAARHRLHPHHRDRRLPDSAPHRPDRAAGQSLDARRATGAGPRQQLQGRARTGSGRSARGVTHDRAALHQGRDAHAGAIRRRRRRPSSRPR